MNSKGRNRKMLPVVASVFLFVFVHQFTASVLLLFSVPQLVVERHALVQYVDKGSTTERQSKPRVLNASRLTNDENTVVNATFANSSKEIVARGEVSFSSNTAVPTVTGTTTTPRTLAFFDRLFIAGFCNNAMVFTSFIMYATRNNFTHVLLNSLWWVDLYGNGSDKNNLLAPHGALFDVDHWNSFYPKLPRLIPYDETQHYEFDVSKRQFFDMEHAETNATHPYAYGRWGNCMLDHHVYTRQLRENPLLERDPTERLILQGALKPSPSLQMHIDNLLLSWQQRKTKKQEQQHRQDAMMKVTTPISTSLSSSPPPPPPPPSYLTLHARIEPDMQHHDVPRCRQFKVIKLSDIIRNLERHFPEPPASIVFIAVNRPLLEKEAAKVTAANNNDTIASDNLIELNRVARDGLWNGTVPVVEAGVPLILQSNNANETFRQFPGIAGAVLDYFLAVEADVFVGTEVSSFSVNVMQSRFFRNYNNNNDHNHNNSINKNRQNYFYGPDGLHWATPLDALQPPHFRC